MQIKIILIIMSLKIFSINQLVEHSWLKKNRSTNCKKITGWASNYNKKIEYKYFKEVALIGDKKYNKIKFDFKINNEKFSAFIRVKNDSVFWLNSNYSKSSDSVLKNEQLFLYFGDKINSEWRLTSSSYLLGDCFVKLSEKKKISNLEYEYIFLVRKFTKNVSDYIHLKEITISSVHGFKKIVIEQSNGRDIQCDFN